jgi:hypothetical protein
MEKVHLGEVVRGRAEAPERGGQDGEEWVAQGLAQGQRENVYVRNAARLYLMKPEFPVTIGSAPNVGKRW